jgi:C_GCAxxG_C_C family probable redox protein
MIDMKTRTEKALEQFRSGLNCSQAALTAYSDELKIDKEQALNLSLGFGGGMGRLQETCGAVTGSYMVIGLYNGTKFTENADKKEAAYTMIQKFSEKFKAIHGSTDCKSLLKCDLRTEAGHRYAKENNLFGTICEDCISDSIRIVGELTGI